MPKAALAVQPLSVLTRQEYHCQAAMVMVPEALLHQETIFLEEEEPQPHLEGLGAAVRLLMLEQVLSRIRAAEEVEVEPLQLVPMQDLGVGHLASLRQLLSHLQQLRGL